MITKEKFLEAAAKRYDSISSLSEINNFYDYEKEFVSLWQNLGKEILEKSISEVSNDRRKKKLSPNLDK